MLLGYFALFVRYLVVFVVVCAGTGPIPPSLFYWYNLFMAVSEERKKYLAKWKAANRDKTRASNARWYEKNHKAILVRAAQKSAGRKDYHQEWRARNRQARREYHLAYYYTNKPKLKEQAVARGEPAAARSRAKKWREGNPDRRKELARQYWEKNKDSIRARLESYETPEFKRENLARYRARKNNAMPKWLTSENKSKIRAIYAEAIRRGLEVDHIIPIRSRVVSGLHVPWNLQLLMPTENRMKSNRLPAEHEYTAVSV